MDNISRGNFLSDTSLISELSCLLPMDKVSFQLPNHQSPFSGDALVVVRLYRLGFQDYSLASELFPQIVTPRHLHFYQCGLGSSSFHLVTRFSDILSLELHF